MSCVPVLAGWGCAWGVLGGVSGCVVVVVRCSALCFAMLLVLFFGRAIVSVFGGCGVQVWCCGGCVLELLVSGALGLWS